MSRNLHKMAVFLQSIFLTLVLTWPSILHLNAQALGSINADSMKHLWTLWWFRRTIYDFNLPFSTDYLNSPYGMDLWPIEPLNGLLACLLPFPIIATANLIVMINMTLNGIFGSLLGGAVSGNKIGAYLSGLLLQTSSFALFTVHVGVGELQHLWLLMLGFWALWMFNQKSTWVRTVIVGLILGVSTLSCFYYGFFMALGFVFLGAWWFFQKIRWDYLFKLSISALLAAVLIIPLMSTFSASYGPDEVKSVGIIQYVFGESVGQPEVDPISARLQPEDLFVSRADLWDTDLRELKAYGGGRLLGFPLLALVIIALVIKPKESLPWFALALLGVLFSLGSFLASGGEDVLFDDRRIRLPFFYLNRLLGYLAEPVNFPVRFLALTSIALTVMASLASKINYKAGIWVIASLGLINTIDIQWRQLLPIRMVSFVPPSLNIPEPQKPGSILDLSAAWREDQESRVLAMSSQIGHQRPIQAVPLDRLEFYIREGRWFASALAITQDLKPGFSNMPITLDPNGYKQDLAVLEESGFKYVLIGSLGGRGPVPQNLEKALTSVFGEPTFKSDNGLLYEISHVEATKQEIEAWQKAHKSKMNFLAKKQEVPGPALDGN